MEQISLKPIREWVRFLRGADKINFAFLGMKHMEALIDIPIKMDFLKVAAVTGTLFATHLFLVPKSCAPLSRSFELFLVSRYLILLFYPASVISILRS